MTPRAKAYVALTIATVIWGATLAIVKPALSIVTPAQFLVIRFAMVTVLMLPITITTIKKTRISLTTLGKVVLIETLGAPIALTLLYMGLARTTAVESSLLAATLPIFITLGGILFLREREEPNEWIGLALGILGTALIVMTPAITDGKSLTLSITGNLFIVGFLFLTAGYYLLAKVVYRALPKLFISTASACVTTIVLGTALWLTDNLPTLEIITEPPVLIATLYAAVLGWIVAFTFYLYGQSLIEASEASLFKYLEGIVAIPVAWILLGEKISLPLAIAVGIVATGVIIGARRFKRRSV